MDFTGPLGGALALAFGSGCAAGYAFAKRNLADDIDKLEAALTKEQESCDMRIKELKEDYNKRITTLKADHEERLSAMQSRIDQLETRFNTLIDRRIIGPEHKP